MNVRQLVVIVFLFLFGLSQTGCATFNKKLKSFLGGGSSANVADQSKPASTLTKFSDSEDVSPRVRRQYKRTTKESLSEEAALDSKAGSLWVMEGQGAYLFSQNVVRLVGDPLAVTLEGDPKDQLQSKASIIKKLLAKIEERQKARLRGPASEESEDADKKDGAKDKDKKAKPDTQQAQKQETPANDTAAELAVKIVPTRIVERTLEGNYRV
jgi:flagellar L-ring protein precursor FlgH